MNIVPEDPPSTVNQEIDAGFLYHGSPTRWFSQVSSPAPSASLRLIPVHKQYTIAFESESALVNQMPGSVYLFRGEAHLVGWRIFEWTRDSEVGARVVWLDEPARQLPQSSRLVMFNLGRYVELSIQGWETAIARKDVVGDYYYRLLTLPQLYTVAIWLHRAGPDFNSYDRLMPISPPPPDDQLESFQLYSPPEFFERIAPRVPAALARAPRPTIDEQPMGPTFTAED